MAHDALAAHARDELGISVALRARPVQAALTSALTFAVGAALPLIIVFMAPEARLVLAVAVASLLCLGILGWLAARTGGARPGIGAARVVFWGALAMGLTAAIGALLESSSYPGNLHRPIHSQSRSRRLAQWHLAVCGWPFDRPCSQSLDGE